VKVGDLVKMKREPFPITPFGLGLLMEVTNGFGFTHKVFFPDLLTDSFNGIKYCISQKLELVSSCSL